MTAVFTIVSMVLAVTGFVVGLEQYRKGQKLFNDKSIFTKFLKHYQTSGVFTLMQKFDIHYSD